MGKNESLVWACGIIQDHMKKDSFGTITVSMASGKISSVKTEIHHKPELDHNNKNA